MTIVAAVTESREGRLALVEALTEAKQLGSELVVVNLGAAKLDLADVDTAGVAVTVVDHRAKDKGESADAVIAEINERNATRLVIGIRRRTATGKLLLGSLSQRLLLNSPVPVLAVKRPEGELSSGGLDDLPGGLRQVTG